MTPKQTIRGKLKQIVLKNEKFSLIFTQKLKAKRSYEVRKIIYAVFCYLTVVIVLLLLL